MTGAQCAHERCCSCLYGRCWGVACLLGLRAKVIQIAMEEALGKCHEYDAQQLPVTAAHCFVHTNTDPACCFGGAGEQRRLLKRQSESCRHWQRWRTVERTRGCVAFYLRRAGVYVYGIVWPALQHTCKYERHCKTYHARHASCARSRARANSDCKGCALQPLPAAASDAL